MVTPIPFLFSFYFLFIFFFYSDINNFLWKFLIDSPDHTNNSNSLVYLPILFVCSVSGEKTGPV